MSRILIIEDEEAIADLEKDYLELSGFEVEIASQGKEHGFLYDGIISVECLPYPDGKTAAVRSIEFMNEFFRA